MTLPRRVETVVVGAGSAGSVIAARITEDDTREVLLLEAGPDYPDPARLPDDLADARWNSMRRHDWGLWHRPTTARRVPFPFPRGKVVGGSSAVNTCIALRGQPYDYDEWAARGLPDWSWEACLPAFRALEHDLDFDTPWHGTTGPLPVRRDRPEDWVPWQAGFVEACRHVGFPACADTNAPDAVGVGPHALNRLHGRRISAAEAWLTPGVRARPNLEVAPGCLVDRVVVQRGRAVAVELIRAGVRHTVEADRVVLTAGAVLTPGILLRSGIGPREVLRDLGVSPVVDNPAVGARLLDHPGSAIFLRPRRGVAHPEHPIIQTVLRYASSHGGRPGDVQVQAGSNGPPSPVTTFVTIMMQVGKPRGTGTIRFPSADPTAKPMITQRFLEDPRDRRVAVEAIELARDLVEGPVLSRLARPLWPRFGRIRTRELLHGFIRRITDSGYHPCGTVPMGADDDPTAATDGRGRVRGVDGLVVADASLMPTIPSSNIHLATLMIGERFGAWLREAP